MEPLRFPASNRNDQGKLRAEAFALIKERSFFRGEIKLASGKMSDFYFDMKPTMFSPDGSVALAKMILQRLQGVDVDYIGGLAMGAVPLVSTVTMLSNEVDKPIPGFFVRKEIKDHGTRRTIEGLAVGETLEGKKVVILDDVTTTGASAMQAVEAAVNAGASVILVLAVVDREEGAAEFYRDAEIPFEALFAASAFRQHA